MRLLEGKNLQRKHWSALSLGPVKHLGLSCAHGEVSSFGTCRLAFWNKDLKHNDEDVDHHDDDDDILQYCKDEPEFNSGSGALKMKQPPPPTTTSWSSSSTTAASSSSSSSTPTAPSSSANFTAASSSSSSSLTPTAPSSSANFLPNLPPLPPTNPSTFVGGTSTPLTPFDQGSLRSSTPARSPFVAAYSPNKQSTPRQQHQQHRITPRIKNPQMGSPMTPATAAAAAAAASADPFPHLEPQKKPSRAATEVRPNSSSERMPSPHHYAKEEFKSSTVPNDSNPIFTNHSSTDNADDGNDNSNIQSSHFHIPLQKDDLLPTLQTDGGRVGLEIRLDEEMARTESLLVGGALSSAVNVASVASSVVGMGKQTKQVSDFAREMTGLSSDRLIGRGYVDLMPLLIGLWEDEWDVSSSSSDNQDKLMEEEDADLDMFGRIPANSRMRRRRVERMGLLDVWVPLHHPADADGKDKSSSSGKVHLLISYEPYGMIPKRDDVVALESFARQPFDQGNGPGNSNNSSSNNGSAINPILPPLSPFLVIDIRGSYLLLEYATSRTVTSVDRLGNIKSSRWERTHRVRIHRNAVFVIERRTLLDVAGNIARLPGDIVLSTPIGQEIAEASAPVVAGAMELMTPAFMSVKLLMGAGGLGVRAGLAGAKAATEAVVSASQQKAMERREGAYVDERGGSESGVYRFA